MKFCNSTITAFKVSQKYINKVQINLNEINFTISWQVFTVNSFFNKVVKSKKKKYLLEAKKKKKLHVIHFDDIKDISYGNEAINYLCEFHVSKIYENLCISITYTDHKKSKIKMIHLITKSQFDFRKLENQLNYLKSLRKKISNFFLINFENEDLDLFQYIFNSIIYSKKKKNSNGICYIDILYYFKKINLHVNQLFLLSIFLKFSNFFSKIKNFSNVGLNFEQFKYIIIELKKRNDFVLIWKNISHNTDKLLYDDFKLFISEVQCENFNEDIIKKVFKKFNLCNENFWLESSFYSFLLSKYCSIFNKIENLNYFKSPFNEYFISSSHNTYLCGWQVFSRSSIENIVKSLKKGCKCIELDLCDNFSNKIYKLFKSNILKDKICVTHRYSFTTSISFENVLETIKKYAFSFSPYPLILSLDIKCSLSKQYTIIETLKKVLNDVLLIESSNNFNTLPSPEELKNRIVLKINERKNPVNLEKNKNLSNTLKIKPFCKRFFFEKNFIFLKRKNKVIKSLSDLAIYFKGQKRILFFKSKFKRQNECFSFSDYSVNKMLKHPKKQEFIMNYNQKKIMRIYPSFYRFNSSNFNPLVYWFNGVQMVATNWQKYDLGQQLNEAMFLPNNNGYLLKKEIFFNQKKKKNDSMNKIIGKKKLFFEFHIISAHQVTNNSININPMVSIEILSLSQNYTHGQILYKNNTLVVPNNGYNPIWNEKFNGILDLNNYLVFIKLVVKSSLSSNNQKKFKNIGLFCCKLFHLKQGYRFLPLNDFLGEVLTNSTLFLKIKYFLV